MPSPRALAALCLAALALAGCATPKSGPDAPPEAVARATLPFLIPIMLAVLMITFVPEISLFLPNLVYGAP